MSYLTPRPTSLIVPPCIASLCAGPIFVIALSVSLTAFGKDGAGGAFALIIFLPITIIFGMLIALLPTLIGTVSLYAIGRRLEQARTPVLWAAAGGTLGAGMGAVVLPSADTVIAFAATGAACALICRWNVDWS